VALISILLAGGIAAENWSFGIERIVNLRIDWVMQARSALAEADIALTNLAVDQFGQRDP
jgi:hypothetical protein